jgi:hypothetical protein
MAALPGAMRLAGDLVASRLLKNGTAVHGFAVLPRRFSGRGYFAGEIKMETGILTLVQDVLYDTAFLPENLGSGNRVQMFSIPIFSYAGRKIKEYEHTNMQMCGCLPSPEEFGIREIRCAFYQGGEWIEPFPGTLKLQQRLQVVHEQPTIPIDAEDLVESRHLRSLTHFQRHPYAKGFLELADKKTPIITQLRTQEYFTCILELDRKPDIPTEFLVVLMGDHFIYDASLSSL